MTLALVPATGRGWFRATVGECAPSRGAAYLDGDTTTSEARAGGLAAWCDAAEARLAADDALITARIVALDACAASAVRFVRSRRKRALVEIALGVVLGFWAWSSARRLSGQPCDEDDFAAVLRVRRALPFGGPRDILRASQNTAVLGVGALALAPSVEMAPHASGRVGYDYAYSHPSRPRAHAPRGASAVDRRLDAAMALRASGVAAADLALLELVDCGALRGKAKRGKHGVEEALMRPEWAAIAATLGCSEREARGRVARAREALARALEARSERCRAADGTATPDPIVPQRTRRAGRSDSI